ncbi:MAG: hypothetical protein L6R36_005940, partial [Xanthoria steineri]
MLSQALLICTFLNHVLGQTVTITAGVTTSTGVKCSTQFANKSVKPPIPTSSVTRTALPNVILIISASTPVSTVTPKPVTTTTTQTIPTTVTITLPGMTGVFSTTSTSTFTNTITAFSTALTTVTSTSSTTTTVTTNVPAPPGFIGVEQSSGDMDAPPAEGRRALSRGFLSRRASPLLGNPTGDQKYPFKVTCIKTVQVVIFKKIVAVKPTSTTTIPASTITIKSTTRPVITATAPGSAVTSTASFQTTTTIDSTTTMVTTTTETTTTTITESSTTSSYLACLPTNQLGPPLSDGRVSTIFAGTDEGLFFYTEVADATTPYECCVACLLSPEGCYASGFFINFDVKCNIFERRDLANVCDNPGFVAGAYDRSRNTGTFNRATYSNGPCGVVVK